MTLEPFEWVLGGRGWGLSITLDPGSFSVDEGRFNFEVGTEPGCEFFPETIIIDLCPEVEDCATTMPVAVGRLRPPAFSNLEFWPSLLANAKVVVRTIAAAEIE